MNHSREIVLASYLFNIGRFYSGGALGLAERCAKVFEPLVRVPLLCDILRGEQSAMPARRIVEEAFTLSLTESEKTAKTAKGKNLTTVFSRVTASEKGTTEKQYYSAAVERPEAVFPSAQPDSSGFPDMEAAFERELLRLEGCPPASWEDFIALFDSLCRKYLWCVTASDYEGEDISLYNQSRIAGAIAECICRCRAEDAQKEDCYLLAVCDFSGIQKYVFSVATVSEAGVAKRLRARSFYVDVTVSVLAQAMIRRFGLTQNHILMQTGGKFYLLLPNTDGAEEQLKAIETEISADFFHTFGGEVAIHLAWLPVGADGLERYSDSVTQLSRRLGDKKSAAFQGVLAPGGEWQESAFVITEALAGKRLCTSCGSALTDRGSGICPNCAEQTEIGGKLPRTRYISYYYGEKPDHAYRIYGDYSIGLSEHYSRDGAFLVEQLNSSDVPEAAVGAPLRTRYMANHIPANESGENLTFSDIAETARGMAKLAVLKADVDNLGYLFADGLRTKGRHFGTISRVNTMSRFLELFFSGYVNRLISGREEYRGVYSVFSGGDDLFLIGPWDVMPKLACEIAEEFRRFSAGNPALTLSATVSVFQPREHIANLAEISERQLKWVKNNTVPALYPEKDGRDGVSFFGQLLSWEDLREQLRIGERLAGLVSRGVLGTAILQRIEQYSRMYRGFLINKDVMQLMFEPLFHYDRQRNYTSIKKGDADAAWFLDEYAAGLTRNAADYRTVNRNLYFAETAARYALHCTKEVRKDGK